jgi:hypothetical protein
MATFLPREEELIAANWGCAAVDEFQQLPQACASFSGQGWMIHSIHQAPVSPLSPKNVFWMLMFKLGPKPQPVEAPKV